MTRQAGGEERDSRCTLEDHAIRVDLRGFQCSDSRVRCLALCLSSCVPMHTFTWTGGENARQTHCYESHEPEGLAIADELSHGRVELELGRCSGSVGSCSEARDRERPRLARDSTEKASDRGRTPSTAAGCLQSIITPRLQWRMGEKAIHCRYRTR